MSKHSKLALFIFPFLLVGGYIAAGYWQEYKATENQLFRLDAEGSCDVLAQKCVLKSGEFEVNVYDQNGETLVNSTFPLDSATFFMVESDGNYQAYKLEMKDNPYYWSAKTPLRQLLSQHRPGDDYYKLRLITQIKGGQYISEFYTHSVP